MNYTLAEVTRTGALDMQVCIPSDWSDEEVKAFADRANPCGTTGGWFVRKDEKLLAGAPYRNLCSQRTGFVHVSLDA